MATFLITRVIQFTHRYMAYAIILLSGSSTRFKGEEPKQFTKINGKPLFMYSLETFLSHPEIERIVLVTLKDYVDYVKEIIPSNKPIDVISGGNSRRESSYLGIKHLCNVEGNSKVLIHDAARPLITLRMIDDLLKSLDESNNSTIASEMNNTLIDVNGNYLNRSKIRTIETPQGFIYSPLLKAHETVTKEVTDDTMLLNEIGYPTKLVLSNSVNLKVTNKEDILIAKAILEGRKG